MERRVLLLLHSAIQIFIHHGGKLIGHGKIDFFDFNPHEKYKWDADIWELMNDRKIKLGMTKEQVRISWSTPQEINEGIYISTTREQWVYDSKYLYFTDGILSSIQNR